jgi:hypothetical protein
VGDFGREVVELLIERSDEISQAIHIGGADASCEA